MSDLEEKKKKFEEDIDMLDESFLAGTLTKSQYDLQMQEKNKEKEEIITRQLGSQQTKPAKMGTITEPKIQESSSKQPLVKEESNEPPLDAEGEKVSKVAEISESPYKQEDGKEQCLETEKLSKESEKTESPNKDDIGREPSFKTHSLRVEIKEPPLDKESEQLESESSNQQSLKQGSKGRKRSSIREIGRSLRRTSMKERRISMKEAYEKRIIAEEPSPKADEMFEQSLSNEQPTEAEKEQSLEEAGNGISKERGGEEESAIGGTSRSPHTGQEREEPTISHEPDVERKKPKQSKKATAKPAPLDGSDSKDADANNVEGESGKEKKAERTSSAHSAMSSDMLNPKEEPTKERSDNQEKGEGREVKEEADENKRNRLERNNQEEAENRIELQLTKDEILIEIKKWGDPEQIKKTIDEQKEALTVKLHGIQLEIQKLELAWKDMGFFGPVVSVVAALTRKAQDREMDENTGTKKRRLELTAKELENENKRRDKRLDRIQSQEKELDYLFKEKEIDETEYSKRKKLLDTEKDAVTEEVKEADEELHRITEQIRIIEKSESQKQKSSDPETGLIQTKLQLEKQVEDLNNQIAEKKRELYVEDEKEAGKMEEGNRIKEELDDRTSEPQGERHKMNEELKTLEQMRNNLEDELVGINGLLERLKGPNQRLMLWGAVAAVAMIYIHEFSKTFIVVH